MAPEIMPLHGLGAVFFFFLPFKERPGPGVPCLQQLAPKSLLLRLWSWRRPPARPLHYTQSKQQGSDGSTSPLLTPPARADPGFGCPDTPHDTGLPAAGTNTHNQQVLCHLWEVNQHLPLPSWPSSMIAATPHQEAEGVAQDALPEPSTEAHRHLVCPIRHGPARQ